MPRPRTASSSQVFSVVGSDSQSAAQSDILCPFHGFDGCNKKKGYSKPGLITHLGNKHFDKVGKDLCRERISSSPEVLSNWEDVLSQFECGCVLSVCIYMLGVDPVDCIKGV